MLKIPTFVLGGLLILTGLIGYLFQAPSLSIVIKGRLADDTKLVFSDGTQTQTVKTEYLNEIESASFQAKEIIEGFYGDSEDTLFPSGPATKAFRDNVAIDQVGRDPTEKKSFWYASSRKDTLEAIIQHTNNENNKDDDYETIPVVWDEIDANSSIIKFVYVNEAGNEGPATLMISNWKNIDMENPPENNTLEFGKSKTAFIPSLIGLILILLVLAAEVKPSARKHIMHLTVLLGLVAFFMVAKMFGPAFAEMSWLRGEPNHIEHTCTIIKPITMLASAGLLLIFVILCVVSFIQARKEMAAQAKKDKLAKKNASQSKPKYKKEDSKNEEKRKQDGKNNAKDKSDPKSSDNKASPNKPKSADDKSGSDKKTSRSPAKDMPREKETGSEKEIAPENKPVKEKTAGTDSPQGKPRERKSEESSQKKESDPKSDGDRPSPVKKESQDALEKKDEPAGEEPRKADGEKKNSPQDGTEEK